MTEQLTLGRLADELARCSQNKGVQFEFSAIWPTDFASWRGVYAEIALGHTGEYGSRRPSVDELLEKTRDAIGEEFTGWKGGEFTMTADTPVWIENRGCYSSNALVGVREDEGAVVLLVERRD